MGLQFWEGHEDSCVNINCFEEQELSLSSGDESDYIPSKASEKGSSSEEESDVYVNI